MRFIATASAAPSKEFPEAILDWPGAGTFEFLRNIQISAESNIC